MTDSTITKDLFDFEKFTYEVVSTQLERKGLLSLFSSQKYDTVYYIRRVHKKYKDIGKHCILMKSNLTHRYEFLGDCYEGTLREIVYWSNSQEPANLITRMKVQDVDSYVIFSSDDIP